MALKIQEIPPRTVHKLLKFQLANIKKFAYYFNTDNYPTVAKRVELTVEGMHANKYLLTSDDYEVCTTLMKVLDREYIRTEGSEQNSWFLIEIEQEKSRIHFNDMVIRKVHQEWKTSSSMNTLIDEIKEKRLL